MKMWLAENGMLGQKPCPRKYFRTEKPKRVIAQTIDLMSRRKLFE